MRMSATLPSVGFQLWSYWIIWVSHLLWQVNCSWYCMHTYKWWVEITASRIKEDMKASRLGEPNSPVLWRVLANMKFPEKTNTIFRFGWLVMQHNLCLVKIFTINTASKFYRNLLTVFEIIGGLCLPFVGYSCTWQPLQDFKTLDLKMAILVLKTAPNHQNSDQNGPSPNFCLKNVNSQDSSSGARWHHAAVLQEKPTPWATVPMTPCSRQKR